MARRWRPGAMLRSSGERWHGSARGRNTTAEGIMVGGAAGLLRFRGRSGLSGSAVACLLYTSPSPRD
eukprot:7959622-Alexandrium_andersonii.AAC.1